MLRFTKLTVCLYLLLTEHLYIHLYTNAQPGVKSISAEYETIILKVYFLIFTQLKVKLNAIKPKIQSLAHAAKGLNLKVE